MSRLKPQDSGKPGRRRHKTYNKFEARSGKKAGTQVSKVNTEPVLPREKAYKDMDFSRDNIGNFEALLPFDEETETICSDFALAENDKAMQDKVKCLVNYLRSKERLLVRQQRQELARQKGRVAPEDQIKAAAKLLSL